MEEKQLNSLGTPVKQGSVVGLVMDRIKEALIKKELRPGDYLPTENELMKNLGVSKTSIREAIKMLQALGVLEIKRGQGTRIRKHLEGTVIDPLIFQLIIEDEEPRDLVELRMIFEPAYMLLAMEKATEEDIASIQAAHEKFERVIEQARQTVDDDIAFHLAILQATHNLLVIRIGETILQLFRAAMIKSLRSNPQVALRDHTKILKAFCERNAHQLREVIIKSFENWKTGL